MRQIKVVLIEDDPMVREVNRQFIERVNGFQIVASAGNGLEGIEKIKQFQPDLVFMDIFMPQLNGIETLREIGSQQLHVDVITVTAANDMPTIHEILQLGVFDYIMKPFTFERIEQTLSHYRKFKEKAQQSSQLTQLELDELFHKPALLKAQEMQTTQQPLSDEELPKGFNKATLEKVLTFLEGQQQGASADDVASNIGVARVTARRYLDLMEKRNMINVDSVYGNIGRPINMYFIENK